MSWCVRSKASKNEIPERIEKAAREWLLSPNGRKFIEYEDRGEWGFDYANALQKISSEILARHGVHILVRSHEAIELDPGENLLPDELRK